MNKLYILLPVHNRRSLTENFIYHLLKQSFQNYHLLLIDDGSNDGTAESVKEKVPFDKLTVIMGKGSWWWAGSLHKGYEWLVLNRREINDEDFVLMINDDVAFDENFLRLGIDILADNNNTLLLAQCYDDGTHILVDKGIQIDWKNLTFNQAQTNNTINCLSTRGLFFRVKDFYKIGGFYPKFLPHYGSDYEFTIRAFKKGFKLMSDFRLKLLSNESTTGYHNLKEKNLFIYLSKVLSKKTPDNPLYKINFVLLTCPIKYKFKHILKIVFVFTKNILKSILISLR